MKKNLILLLTLGWLSAISASAQGSLVEQYDAMLSQARSTEDSGQFEQAITEYTACLNLLKKNWPENESAVALYANIGYLYNHLGQTNEAVKTYKEALTFMRKIHQDTTNNYSAILSRLCLIYFDKGQYNEAIALVKESLTLQKKAGAKESIGYATTLSNLGEMYRSIGDFSNAEKYLKESLQCYSKLKLNHDNERLNYALVLDHMGGLQRDLGNLKQAEQYYLKAIEIEKDIEDGRTSSYSMTLNNLGVVCMDLNKEAEAVHYLYESMRVKQRISGSDNTDYAMALCNLAQVYGNKGQYRIQEQCLLEALKRQKGADGGEHHPAYANIITNLASVYARMGQPEKEEKYLLEALRLRKEIFGEKHPDYIFTLTNIGVHFSNEGRYTKAANYITESAELMREQFLSAADYLSERQRNDYWLSIRFPFERVYPTFAHRYRQTKPAITGFAYDNALFVKGLLLSTSNTVQQAILSSGDQKLISNWKELIKLRQDIQREMTENPGSELLHEMEQQAEDLEKKLLSESSAYRDVEKQKNIGWKDVQQQLGENDIAIEFLRIAINKDTVCYSALVLQKKSRYPEMIDLCLESDLMELVPKGRPSMAYDPDFLEEKRNLSNLIWGRLQPYMKEGGKVYFSPDGALYQVAIEYLPMDAERTFSDGYNMYRLSSTRELCNYARSTHSRIRIQDAVLYGGLQYDLTRDDIARQSQSFRSVQPSGEQDDNVEKLLSDSTRGGISYLPGTLKEVQVIRAILNNPDDRIYTGKDGNEESFKALSGHCPGLLHIGTHGFYLPPRKNEKAGGLQLGDSESQNRIDYSMSRTGLLLAGSQLAWSGQSVPEGVEDGILTAKEIAGLDLRTVDCAVLSACETGNGDITGDGVAGLQRGFKQAGVKTLMMSLWPVNDSATELLMTEFYRRWKNGNSKREALRQAQHVVRESYEDPSNWAAFILLDALEEE